MSEEVFDYSDPERADKQIDEWLEWERDKVVEFNCICDLHILKE